MSVNSETRIKIAADILCAIISNHALHERFENMEETSEHAWAYADAFIKVADQGIKERRQAAKVVPLPRL